MAQISLYIEDAIAEKLNIAAKSRNCSVSKFVAAIVSERLSEEDAENERKMQILRELRGSIDDPTFVEPPDIPLDTEIQRRYDLI